MKKISFLLTIFSFFMLASFTSYAQLGGKLKALGNKAKDKMTKSTTKQNTDPVPETKTPPSSNSTPAVVSSPELKEDAPYPIQTKYVGQVVFSNEEIIKEEEEEASFITETSFDQPLAYRVYFEKNMNQLIEEELNRSVPNTLVMARVTLDGKEIGEFIDIGNTKEFDELKATALTFRGRLVAPKSEEEASYVTSDWKKIVTQNYEAFSVGKHELGIEIFIRGMYYQTKESNKEIKKDGQVIASGKITLNVTKPFIYLEAPDYCLPDHVYYNNTEIEPYIKEKIKTQYPDIKIIIHRLGMNTWKINRHGDGGMIKNREMKSLVAFEKEGKCYYNYFFYTQESNGFRFFEDTYSFSRAYYHIDQPEIPCPCIK